MDDCKDVTCEEGKGDVCVTATVPKGSKLGFVGLFLIFFIRR